LEQALADANHMVHADESSPERFEIVLEAIKRSGKPHLPVRPLIALTVMPSIITHMRRSLTSLDRNPKDPRTEIDASSLADLEDYASRLGIGAIDYTRLPRKLVFQNKAVLHDHAIVLSMEMAKDKIEQAPSEATAYEVMQTYNRLGIAANKLTRYLRERGYSAHAGHPLGGLVLYPPLAQLAGLGWYGRHGMLITPQFGPRHRLTAIYTNISNLPIPGENRHAWVSEFCASCGRCIRKCPVGAIREIPIQRENGLMSHVDRQKCFPYFMDNHGCSVCIKECQFNRKGYAELLRLGNRSHGDFPDKAV
jgi:ferredoxin